MTIENALDLSLDGLAESLTHCFEGYIVPAHFTSALAANIIRVDAIDLASSLVARIEDEIVGVTLVARRGPICRIAAMAVAKSARRKGVGKAVLARAIEDARSRGEQQVVLEVIEQNPPAIELYKSMGFEIQHRLLGLEGVLPDKVEVLQPSLLGPTPKTAARKNSGVAHVLKDCSFSDVAASLRQRGFLATSWSMSPATVEQLASPTRPVRCGEVYAVISVSSEEVIGCRSLGFSKSPSKEALKTWISAMANAYPGRKLYLPAFFPEPEYGDAFADSGLQIGAITQFQMALNLAD